MTADGMDAAAVAAGIKAKFRARTLAVAREAAWAGIAPPGLRDALMRHPSRGAMEQAMAEWHEPVWADGLVARPDGRMPVGRATATGAA